MQSFRWLLGMLLIVIPVVTTIGFIIVTFWKIILTAILFFAMIVCGIVLLNEEKFV